MLLPPIGTVSICRNRIRVHVFVEEPRTFARSELCFSHHEWYHYRVMVYPDSLPGRSCHQAEIVELIQFCVVLSIEFETNRFLFLCFEDRRIRTSILSNCDGYEPALHATCM